MARKPKPIRLVVEMYGGCVDAVRHVEGPPFIEVIVTEGAKYAEGEKLFIDSSGWDRAVIVHVDSERCSPGTLAATFKAAALRMRRARRREREQAKLRVSAAVGPRS
jgi:hypothetical protein